MKKQDQERNKEFKTVPVLHNPVFYGQLSLKMPRTRSVSSSKPAFEPTSRPPSMMSTALNLSPQVLGLGDTLITKLTGFAENEENFEICQDFVVSNLLYHTYLEPHERDVGKKCEKLAEKWSIQNMAIRVVEFSNGGYKIRKIFA